jgi:signal transduction histidine kinase
VRRHATLAALLLSLAVLLPLLSWALAGREAAWRMAGRVEQVERERLQALGQSRARLIARELAVALDGESVGVPHRWVRERLRGDAIPAEWRSLGREPAAGDWRIVSVLAPGAAKGSRPEIVALRSDGSLALVLDDAAIGREEDVVLRPVRLGLGARIPLLQAADLAWGVHAVDLGALRAAHERAQEIERRFDRVLVAGTIAILLGWALSLGVLLRTLADEHRRARLAAVAAHELRTPLASLSVHAELLAAWPELSPEARERAALIASEAARLARTVTQVLDEARLERAGRSVHVVPGDLVAAVAREVERLRPALELRGAAIEVEPPAAPVAALFDEDALDHVVGNLVENAARHAPGPIFVRVRRDRSRATIEVVDRGPGLRKSRSAGLGLGLSLSRRLAKAMGGSLELAETPGGGVTARVTLRAS